MSTIPLPATESRVPAAAFPLGLAAVGETLEIQSFRSGMEMEKRLAAMGLRPGTLCQVLQNERPGGIVLRVGQSRLALGMGMAHKILVTRK
ncbi:FeoA domain protein [mine drainage metagenome]|uniref:FeoA domain protein n=1 Tax=mine drainage metagenome TaxID=410659 RepID=A0A1J5PZN5_9ZZZZ